MTPLTLDSTPAVGSVRRPTALDNTRANAAGEAKGANTPAESPARPSVVLNLTTSANQTALSNLTYTNPRAGAAARAADAQAQAANAPRPTEREDTERQDMEDRQNLQAAQATNTQRQAVAADQTA